MARHSESSGKSTEVDSSTDKIQRRRMMKHMVEKRRRNRINDTLEKMRVLVLKALNKNPENYNKMEKLDIMEMTTNFMFMVNQQRTSAQTKHVVNYPGHMTSSHVTSAPHVNHSALTQQYHSGYVTCQNEINNFFKTYELQQQPQNINNVSTSSTQPLGIRSSGAICQTRQTAVFSPILHEKSTVRISPLTSTPRSQRDVYKPLHVSTSFNNDSLLESSLDNAVTSSTPCCSSTQSGLLCTVDNGKQDSQIDINVIDISTSSDDSSVWRPW